MKSIYLSAIIATILANGQARGQRVDLYGSGSAVGQTKVTDNGKSEQVWVKLDDQVVLSVPKARVQTVEASSKLAEYQKYAAQTGDDPLRHYKLSRWCKKESLPHQARYHLQRVISLDPDHKEARNQLRYHRVAGEWVKWSTLQRQRGLVHLGGNTWKAPELVAREETRKANDKAAKEWTRKLSRQMLPAVTRGEEGAMQQIEEINDPLATDAVVDQLTRSRNGSQPRAMRRLWIELLGRFRTPNAVKALVEAGLSESDPKIRQDALEQLAEYGTGSAIGTYTKILVDGAAGKLPHPNLLRRAAVALQYFPDSEKALVYVDALVTEHVRAAAPQPGMSFGFGDNGVGGMQTGGSPQAEVRRSENIEVLNLLKLIEPDADYGFNEQAWKRYIAAKRSRFEGDLRRDL